MEKRQIEDIIEQLKEYEEALSSNDDIDENFISSLDNILSKISTEVNQTLNTTTIDYSLKIKVKKLHENAVIPTYSKPGDAGMDLTITSVINETDVDITYGFGIAMEIPMGYVGLVFPRSSVRKYKLLLTNSVGVIDSGYRGEIQATFKKTNTEANVYKVGERGAQIIILPYPQVVMVESDELSDTERGDGGFGSTGK